LYGNKLSEYPSTWNYFWTQKLKYGLLKHLNLQNCTPAGTNERSDKNKIQGKIFLFFLFKGKKNRKDVKGKTKRKYDRPKRPCLFCGKFTSRLSKHSLAVHKQEEEIKHITGLQIQEKEETGITGEEHPPGLMAYLP